MRSASPVAERNGRDVGSIAERQIFIAGCPRSGTSALVFLLNEHPQLAIGFERFKRVRANLDPFHLRPAQFFSPLAVETDIRGELLYERLRARWDSGRVTVIGDKVPLYTRVLPQLLRRFPAGRVVVLVRDPLAVATSFRRRASDPNDWWPAENDHRLAVEMWNEALASSREVERRGDGDRVFLLPYEPLLAGDERWLEALMDFIDLPSHPLLVEHRQLAAAWRERGSGHAHDADLIAYVEAHRDPVLAAWAHTRMELQLGGVSAADPDGPIRRPSEIGDKSSTATAEQSLIGQTDWRVLERKQLLEEMRSPGHRRVDELDILERRLLEQTGEIARRGERLQGLATRDRSSPPRLDGRVTLILPHQRQTTGGVYAIEQFSRHLVEHVEVSVLVRDSSTRPIPGVRVCSAAELDSSTLPRADVLLYPADMKDAERVLALPRSVGRPVMFFQGYGTPGSPVVSANLDAAQEGVAVARWLVEDALKHGTACTYVPHGLDRDLFACGPPTHERRARVSVMTHSLDWKGLADALAAISLVRSVRDDVEVIFFGVEPVVDAGVFVESPTRAQVAALLRSSAVHIVASWEEGFGLTGAEAIACGAALATTDTKGSREYALDGHTALVSAPCDPRALADNVLRLLEDADLRERLVVTGQRHLRSVMPPWSEVARRMAFALFGR
jgi:hypothetical protein